MMQATHVQAAPQMVTVPLSDQERQQELQELFVKAVAAGIGGIVEQLLHTKAAGSNFAIPKARIDDTMPLQKSEEFKRQEAILRRIDSLATTKNIMDESRKRLADLLRTQLRNMRREELLKLQTNYTYVPGLE